MRKAHRHDAQGSYINGTCAVLIAPEVLEAVRRQLGVFHRVLDIAVAQIGLQRAGRANLNTALKWNGCSDGAEDRARVEGAEKMSRRPRRNHSSAFKAKVAIEALEADGKTIAEIAAKQNDVHPNQVTEWQPAV